MKAVVSRTVPAIVLASALSGCAQFERATSALSSPAATQAAVNVGAIANAVECFVAAGSGAVLTGLRAGKAAGQTTTTIIYTVSAGLCVAKGGTIGAPVAVPQSSVVTQ